MFEADDGYQIFDEWFSILKQNEIMTDVHDVAGLAAYLYHSGHLIAGDKIRYEPKAEQDGPENDLGSEEGQL